VRQRSRCTYVYQFITINETRQTIDTETFQIFYAHLITSTHVHAYLVKRNRVRVTNFNQFASVYAGRTMMDVRIVTIHTSRMYLRRANM